MPGAVLSSVLLLAVMPGTITEAALVPEVVLVSEIVVVSEAAVVSEEVPGAALLALMLEAVLALISLAVLDSETLLLEAGMLVLMPAAASLVCWYQCWRLCW